MGDFIQNLPTDQSIPNHEELAIVENLFKNHKKTMGNVLYEFRDSIIAGLLFILFSVPQIDQLFHKIVPITEKSFIILLIIKTIIFIVLLYVIINFAFSKKN